MPNYSEKDLQQFLDIIEQLESSGGKNTNHRVLQSGMHEGESAYGSRALMPKTIIEMANRRKLGGENDPVDDAIIQDTSQENIKELLQSYPEKTEEYERMLAERVMNTAKGDPAVAASGWLYGHNLSEKRMKDKLKNDPEYQERIDNVIYSENAQSRPDKTIYDIPSLEEARFSRLQKLFNRNK